MDGLNGKIKRAATSFVLPVDVNRAGECKGCGACCMFVYKCPFLRFENHNSHRAICTIYEFRPPMCRKYPRIRDEQARQQCGYYFTEATQSTKPML
jgi:Fe-S-cluster containining protein